MDSTIPGSGDVFAQVGIVIEGTTPSSLRCSELFKRARFLGEHWASSSSARPAVRLRFDIVASDLSICPRCGHLLDKRIVM